jgi:prepilin-type N-terminal cleavage/methylation domain-containing protein/prepilin-type processing-associated H-X9-DG protein
MKRRCDIAPAGKIAAAAGGPAEGKRRRSPVDGFTIIELLVVIAVLTLLAGILLPVLALARDAAGRARCLSNLRQLALAHQAYVQDYDEALPPWVIYQRSGPRLWTEFLRPYYGDARLLDQGFMPQEQRRKSGWVADYVMCTWGPGGNGTLQSPYWRWPGAPSGNPEAPRPMRLSEVRRPAETLQFIDGVITSTWSTIHSYHRNGVRNGAFLDGHAHRISDADWDGVRQDERGYFYWIAAADR